MCSNLRRPSLAEVDYLPDNMYQPEAVPHSHTPEGEDLPDGLVFISGGGFKFYAIDNVSGKTLYGVDLDGGGYGNPMTYQTHSGRQFVVIATGRGSDAKLIAFALPQH